MGICTWGCFGLVLCCRAVGVLCRVRSVGQGHWGVLRNSCLNDSVSSGCLMPSFPARAHETETTPCVEATQLPMSRLRTPEPSSLTRQGAQTHSPRHLSIQVKKITQEFYRRQRNSPSRMPKTKSKSPLQQEKKKTRKRSKSQRRLKCSPGGRRGSAPRPFPGSVEAGRARTRRGLSDRRCETSDRAGPCFFYFGGAAGRGKRKATRLGCWKGKAVNSVGSPHRRDNRQAGAGGRSRRNSCRQSTPAYFPNRALAQ